MNIERVGFNEKSIFVSPIYSHIYMYVFQFPRIYGQSTFPSRLYFVEFSVLQCFGFQLLGY